MTAPRDDEPQRVEAYLDALLTARERMPGGEPGGFPFAGRLPALDDPRLAAAATALHTSLVRFHPSFRFEDRLAARLRASARGEATPVTIAETSGTPETAGALGTTIIAFPAVAPQAGGFPDPDHARGLLLGGAIASGVSIAGAAIFAWRRQRGGRSRTGIA